MKIPVGLAVKKSTNGKGIFTTRIFKKGKNIFHIQGKLFHHTKTYTWEGPLQDNTFRYSENYYLSPQGYIGDYLNHACEPNAAIAKRNRRLYVWALRNIGAGEEIFIDYSTITASDDIWTMQCNCGCSSCRGTIRNWRSLPKILVQRYKLTGALPTHIRKIG